MSSAPHNESIPMASDNFVRSQSGGLTHSVCLLCDIAVVSGKEPLILSLLEAAHVCSALDLLNHQKTAVGPNAQAAR